MRHAINNAALGVRSDALLSLLLVNLIDQVNTEQEYEKEVGYDSEYARNLSKLSYELEVAGVKYLGSQFVEINCE